MSIPESPAFDRTVQCAFRKYVVSDEFSNLHEAPTVAETFGRTLRNFYLERKRSEAENEQQALFRLPPHIKVLICKWMTFYPVLNPSNPISGLSILDTDLQHLEANASQVTLNRRYFNRDFYPKDHFQSFADASASLRRHNTVCFALHAELTVMFCIYRHFHVTVSPFLGPLFSPLAVEFIHRYSTFMSNITVEFDLTKLGYGADPRAAGLRPGTLNMRGWVDNFVKAQRKRRGFSTLWELRLLCRRYHGNRPTEPRFDGQPRSRGTGPSLCPPSSLFSASSPFLCPFSSNTSIRNLCRRGLREVY